MAKKITIPLDVHLITLCYETSRIVAKRIQIGKRFQTRRLRVNETVEVTPGVTTTRMGEAIAIANKIFAKADISFKPGIRTDRVPALQNKAEVDRDSLLYLDRKFPAKKGARVLVIKKFADKSLGGESAEKYGVCILEAHETKYLGKILAHELGHLAGLKHFKAKTAEERAKNVHNLMNPGLLLGEGLTPEQIVTLRGSKLVAGAKATSGN